MVAEVFRLTDKQTIRLKRPTGRHTYIVRDTDWLSLKVKEGKQTDNTGTAKHRWTNWLSK